MARTAEAAFAGTERRADLDRWYVQLIASLKDGIECAAVSPFSKSPAAVVRFENYHHLYCTLKRLDFAVNIIFLFLYREYRSLFALRFYVRARIKFTILKYLLITVVNNESQVLQKCVEARNTVMQID